MVAVWVLFSSRGVDSWLLGLVLWLVFDGLNQEQ